MFRTTITLAILFILPACSTDQTPPPRHCGALIERQQEICGETQDVCSAFVHSHSDKMVDALKQCRLMDDADRADLGHPPTPQPDINPTLSRQ